jgi:hypothetical protein
MGVAVGGGVDCLAVRHLLYHTTRVTVQGQIGAIGRISAADSRQS